MKSLRTRGSSSAAIGMSPNSASAFVSMRLYSALVLAASVVSNSVDNVNRRTRLLNVPASRSRISFSAAARSAMNSGEPGSPRSRSPVSR
jgi:hypothetical protein